MKLILLIATTLLLLQSCDYGENKRKKKDNNVEDTTASISDTIMLTEQDHEHEKVKKTYSNDAFRDINVEKVGDKRWKISGEARVFEANFSYYVEDGHYKLAEGNAMADEGAPAWGRFSFYVEPDNITDHTQPHLVLYEASAKDGRPINELAVPLK